MSQTATSFAHDQRVGYRVGRSTRERVLNSPTARLEFSYALLETHREFFERDRRARAFRWRRIGVMEGREGNLALSWRALLRSLRAVPTPRTGVEVLRLLRQTLARRRPPSLIGERKLPPLTTTRGAQFRGLRRGSQESRQYFRSRVLTAVISCSSGLRPPVKGRIRRAATKLNTDRHVRAMTAWGEMELEPNEVRLLSPYCDEVLEMALIARFLLPGMTVLDIGANRGRYTLMASRRVGVHGRVVAVEPDPRMTRRVSSIIDRNKLSNVTLVEVCDLLRRWSTVDDR